MNKFLIIQTAFIGDVILATPVIEKLHSFFPEAQIDFLLRKGNESLLENHPKLNEVIVWDKGVRKFRNLGSIISKVRDAKYDCVINLHRFLSSGMVTTRSGAKQKIGFDKNPFSMFYSRKVKHVIDDNTHEVDRNLSLIEEFTDSSPEKPKLYPSTGDREAIAKYQGKEYACIAPASVWYTKQFPLKKWAELLKRISPSTTVYILGSTDDSSVGQAVIAKSRHENAANLCGKLTFLQTAALMEKANMNYVNDSAPLHLASAMNAPVKAVYCSTVPKFGFGPLSDNSAIIETLEELKCKPCGLHGYSSCPEGHFKCAESITIEQLLGTGN